jgi:hypothetical protein
MILQGLYLSNTHFVFILMVKKWMFDARFFVPSNTVRVAIKKRNIFSLFKPSANPDFWPAAHLSDKISRRLKLYVVADPCCCGKKRDEE